MPIEANPLTLPDHPEVESAMLTGYQTSYRERRPDESRGEKTYRVRVDVEMFVDAVSPEAAEAAAWNWDVWSDKGVNVCSVGDATEEP